MNLTASQFQYRTPIKWQFTFLAVSIFPFGFSIWPWVIVLQNNNGLEVQSLFLGIFTALFFALGIHLLSLVFRSTCFTVDEEKVFRTVSIFGWKVTRQVSIDQIYLVRQWFGRRNLACWLAIYTSSNGTKSLLASEQVCSRVPELYNWLESNTTAKCIDMRTRAPIS